MERLPYVNLLFFFEIALPNHFVVQRVGDRAVVMIGGLCAFVSLLVASFAPTVTVWAIAIGGGVGKSMPNVYAFSHCTTPAENHHKVELPHKTTPG